MEDSFTKWYLWQDRDGILNLQYPGIYSIAITEQDISSEQFRWQKDIVYFGMTNAINGLKGRLKQFDNTIKGKRGHGGADRVKYEWPDYDPLIKKLYVSVKHFECDVKSNQPEDLRIMGNVLKCELDCFAHYVERYGQLPQFNDKKRASKKFSRHGAKPT